MSKKLKFVFNLWIKKMKYVFQDFFGSHQTQDLTAQMGSDKISKLRKCYRAVLEEKLGGKSATMYETAIYNMCVRVAKREEGDIEDIYTEIAYDKTGQLMVASAHDRVKILNDLKNTVEDWDSCIYFEQQTEYNRSLDRSVQKPVAVEGVYTCGYKGCKSDKFYMWSQQTKSSDEGMTQFRQCAVCGKRRKE